MTELQSWQAVVDSTFLERLLRPSIQPGCIDRRVSQAIASRYQQFTDRLPLLSHLLQRQNHLAGFQADSLPIVYAQPVYAQPVPSQSNTSVQTNVLEHSDHNQTIHQTHNRQSHLYQTANHQAQINQTANHQAQINQTQTNRVQANQKQTNQKQTNHHVQINQTQTNPEQRQPIQKKQSRSQPSAKPTVIQAKFTASSSATPEQALPSSARSTEKPVRVQLVRLAQSATAEQLHSNLPQIPIVQLSIPQSASSNSLPQPAKPMLNQIKQQFIQGKSSSQLTLSSTLPIIQVSHASVSISPSGMTQPLVFSTPIAQPPEPRFGEMENLMRSQNGNPTHKFPNGSNSPPVVTGQPVTINAEQVKRLIDVESIADKVERQLMRKLSVEHERRGWSR